MKIKFRVVLLVFLVLVSIYLIAPSFNGDGVAIRSVADNSFAQEAGIFTTQNTLPRSLEVIERIDNQPVITIYDFYRLVENKSLVAIETNRGGYYTVNVSENFGGLTVVPRPQSNIQLGLDLAGGVRVLLTPDKQLDSAEVNTMIGALERRLNVFGLADVRVQFAGESLLSDAQYFIVEMGGATLSEVETLLSTQGDFEARIQNKTVFTGDDIVYIEKRFSEGAGVQANSCGQFDGGFSCQYSFPITLTQQAARAQADATRDLQVIRDGSGAYLNESIQLYLDGVMVDELRIGAELRGRELTIISISGSGSGMNRDEAITNALARMEQFQILLESGNLPAQLEVVKSDTISADLGPTFLFNAVLAGLAAIFVVTIVLFLRYKTYKIALPAIAVVISEVIILLGFSVFIRWSIDLASIAGIIIIVGTGVDHLIIIADQIQSSSKGRSIKGKIKEAFRLIIVAFITTVMAMIPLYFAGAGLLQGFATITIFGLILAITITRPAFGAMIE